MLIGLIDRNIREGKVWVKASGSELLYFRERAKGRAITWCNQDILGCMDQLLFLSRGIYEWCCSMAVLWPPVLVKFTFLQYYWAAETSSGNGKGLRGLSQPTDGGVGPFPTMRSSVQTHLMWFMPSDVSQLPLGTLIDHPKEALIYRSFSFYLRLNFMPLNFHSILVQAINSTC